MKRRASAPNTAAGTRAERSRAPTSSIRSSAIRIVAQARARHRRRVPTAMRAPTAGRASSRTSSRHTRRIQTGTRLVKVYLEKETALATAVRNADADALGALLTDDFELRVGARAARPIARADWMRELLRRRDPGGDISGMAVHDFGAAAIASF